MTASRATFLIGSSAFAAVGLLSYPAEAAEFSYKLSTQQPPDVHLTRHLVDAASKIQADSSGRLEIQVFPSSVLGSGNAQVTQLRSGAIQFTANGLELIAPVAAVAGIPFMPFAFPNAKAGYSTMSNRPLGKYIRGAIEKVGLYTFDRAWGLGFRNVVNSRRPVVTPEDLQGLKIRVPASPILVSTFTALGANPTPLDATQIYTGLQTHLVDGLEASLSTIEAFKFYEVQKYVSYTNHVWNALAINANGEAWQRLPKNLQDIVERRFDEAAVLDQADNEAEDVSLEKTLKSQGMLFNSTNTGPFRAVLRKAGFYTQWRQTYGEEAWGLLEKAVGKLT